MSIRFAVFLIVIGVVGLCAGYATRVVVESRRSTEPMVAPPPGSDTDRSNRRQEFFGGDPDRDVRGGQEMKPRW